MIEIKEIEPKSVARLLEVVAKWGSLQYVVIISFSKEIVTEVRKLNHQVNIQWLAEMTIEKILIIVRDMTWILTVIKSKFQKKWSIMHIVREYYVNTWTVDYGEEMQNLVDMGVDCISTECFAL